MPIIVLGVGVHLNKSIFILNPLISLGKLDKNFAKFCHLKRAKFVFTAMDYY